MARIESLEMLLEEGGKDFLAEEYGKVIENVEKNTISTLLKNNDLSGSFSAGTIEAKRFVNAQSKDYGTARSANAGEKVKVRPVTVAIDKDREIIEEIENKDISLYGVEGLVSRRTMNHQRSMIRELERAFFNEALEEGNEVNFTAATDADKLEELIQLVETTQNDFVDGVPRDMINIILSPSEYGKIRMYLDKASNSNIQTNIAEFGEYHGVKVFSSTYLPAGCSHIAMVDGAIAEPILPTVANPERIQLSNAIGFGIFFSYGVKCVMPDLIYFAGSFSTGLSDLTVNSTSGTSGHTKITVSPEKSKGTHYVYKIDTSITMPSAYDSVADWTAWDGTSEIAATSSKEIAIVEANRYNKAIHGGKATVQVG